MLDRRSDVGGWAAGKEWLLVVMEEAVFLSNASMPCHVNHDDEANDDDENVDDDANDDDDDDDANDDGDDGDVKSKNSFP